VLAYHKIAEPSVSDANPNTCVTPANFKRQMLALSLMGYRSADHGEYLKARLGLPARLPEKPVLITFDDAFESVLTRALPVLKKYGFSAAVFMVSSALGGNAFWDGETSASGNRLLDAGGLKLLMAEGWAIGSHGVSHRDFRRLDGPELAAEAARSKAGLEAALGSEVSWFAYPYGANTPAARRAVAAAGYRIGFATESGDGEIFSVPRRIISGKSGLLNFWLRLFQAGKKSVL
jgi:peptidoglycan/xylan/chitin deacetylase (PgdA/CDA1 family)